MSITLFQTAITTLTNDELKDLRDRLQSHLSTKEPDYSFPESHYFYKYFNGTRWVRPNYTFATSLECSNYAHEQKEVKFEVFYFDAKTNTTSSILLYDEGNKSCECYDCICENDEKEYREKMIGAVTEVIDLHDLMQENKEESPEVNYIFNASRHYEKSCNHLWTRAKAEFEHAQRYFNGIDASCCGMNDYEKSCDHLWTRAKAEFEQAQRNWEAFLFDREQNHNILK